LLLPGTAKTFAVMAIPLCRYLAIAWVNNMLLRLVTLHAAYCFLPARLLKKAADVLHTSG